jgi:hypothetical protein
MQLFISSLTRCIGLLHSQSVPRPYGPQLADLTYGQGAVNEFTPIWYVIIHLVLLLQN